MRIPMAVLVGVVGALSAFYHDSLDINDPEHRKISAFRLVAKLPTIVAMAYKYSMGQPFVYPRNDLSYSANFMRMMFAHVPTEEYKVNDVLVRALDRIFILHADHEQNASTSTVRQSGSSGANPFACIAAGIACLWGPAHGGANEACLNMLEEIGDVSKVGEFIKQVKDKNSNVKLMGFGHRVYKNYDPRAKLMRETCHEVLNELGLHDDRLFKLAIAHWKRSRSRTSTSCSASSIRTSISTRASCSARWASRRHVHLHLRAGPHRGLDRAMERDDQRSGKQDRPSAPALHRRSPARREGAQPALIRFRPRRGADDAPRFFSPIHEQVTQ
jgi:hypothetical protein